MNSFRLCYQESKSQIFCKVVPRIYHKIEILLQILSAYADFTLVSMKETSFFLTDFPR